MYNTVVGFFLRIRRRYYRNVNVSLTHAPREGAYVFIDHRLAMRMYAHYILYVHHIPYTGLRAPARRSGCSNVSPRYAGCTLNWQLGVSPGYVGCTLNWQLAGARFLFCWLLEAIHPFYSYTRHERHLKPRRQHAQRVRNAPTCAHMYVCIHIYAYGDMTHMTPRRRSTGSSEGAAGPRIECEYEHEV